MSERTAKDVVEEMFRRQQAGDTALDDLVAACSSSCAAEPRRAHDVSARPDDSVR